MLPPKLRCDAKCAHNGILLGYKSYTSQQDNSLCIQKIIRFLRNKTESVMAELISFMSMLATETTEEKLIFWEVIFYIKG